MKLLLLSAALALTACATPTTGVVPLSDGLRKVTHQTNAGIFYNSEQLKADAIKEASESCAKESKTFRLIDITQRPPRAFGGWPEAEVLFKCD